MRIGVEVRIVVDRIGPNASPPVFFEHLPETAAFIACLRRQDAAKKQNRQIAIRDVPAFAETDLAGRFHGLAVAYLLPKELAPNEPGTALPRDNTIVRFI